VSHGSHNRSQVSGSLENPSSEIVPPTIENKIFGKPCFSPGFSKSLRHRSEMSRLCAFGRENPAFALRARSSIQNVESTIAHWHTSTSPFGFAVGDEDQSGFRSWSLMQHSRMTCPDSQSIAEAQPVSRPRSRSRSLDTGLCASAYYSAIRGMSDFQFYETGSAPS
jgi:hypothetical protein